MEQQFLSTKEIIGSIMETMRSADIDDAADMYAHCQEDIGFQLISLAGAAHDVKVQQNLARMFYRARDFAKSALMCEELGEYDKAAALYGRCDDYFLAAEMFSKIERFEEAAQMYERTGAYTEAGRLYTRCNQFDHAASAYERGGDFFLAGKLFYQQRNFNKAMDVLQKLKADDDNFLEATVMIAEILTNNGYLDLAIQRLTAVISAKGLVEQTVDMYYTLATLYEKQGQFNEAYQCYTNLANYDFNYKDVAARMQQVKNNMTSAAPAPAQPATPVQPAAPQAPGMPGAVPGAPPAPGAQPPAQPPGAEVLPAASLAALQDNDVPEQKQEGEAIVTMMEGFEFLQGLSLFEDLSLQEMKKFYSICETRNFLPNQVIIEQGQPGQALFIIKAGTISIDHLEADGSTKHLVDLGAGVHVGEMSLVDHAPTSARVTAKGPVEAFAITRDYFEQLLQSNDKIALKLYRVFINTLCERLRKTTGELAEERKSTG